MLKVVWRFNLRDGIDEAEFFAWLRQHVWSSSARHGCVTTAYRLEQGARRYSTEAVWPDDAARQAWAESAEFSAIPPYPGTDSPWGAQTDMEAVIYRPL